MTELTLQEKKEIIIETITRIDYITNTMKLQEVGEFGEPWQAGDYKTFLKRKLGEIEYQLQTTEDEEDEDEVEVPVTQATQEVTEAQT